MLAMEEEKMTKAEILKKEILRQYRSVRQFALEMSIPYSTLVTALERVEHNSSQYRELRTLRPAKPFLPPAHFLILRQKRLQLAHHTPGSLELSGVHESAHFGFDLPCDRTLWQALSAGDSGSEAGRSSLRKAGGVLYAGSAGGDGRKTL